MTCTAPGSHARYTGPAPDAQGKKKERERERERERKKGSGTNVTLPERKVPDLTLILVL